MTGKKNCHYEIEKMKSIEENVSSFSMFSIRIAVNDNANQTKHHKLF